MPWLLLELSHSTDSGNMIIIKPKRLTPFFAIPEGIGTGLIAKLNKPLYTGFRETGGMTITMKLSTGKHRQKHISIRLDLACTYAHQIIAVPYTEEGIFDAARPLLADYITLNVTVSSSRLVDSIVTSPCITV
jgi:hypothetical protein